MIIQEYAQRSFQSTVGLASHCMLLVHNATCETYQDFHQNNVVHAELEDSDEIY